MLKATTNGDPARSQTRDPLIRSPRCYNHCGAPVRPMTLVIKNNGTTINIGHGHKYFGLHGEIIRLHRANQAAQMFPSCDFGVVFFTCY